MLRDATQTPLPPLFPELTSTSLLSNSFFSNNSNNNNSTQNSNRPKRKKTGSTIPSQKKKKTAIDQTTDNSHSSNNNSNNNNSKKTEKFKGNDSNNKSTPIPRLIRAYIIFDILEKIDTQCAWAIVCPLMNAVVKGKQGSFETAINNLTRSPIAKEASSAYIECIRKLDTTPFDHVIFHEKLQHVDPNKLRLFITDYPDPTNVYRTSKYRAVDFISTFTNDKNLSITGINSSKEHLIAALKTRSDKIHVLTAKNIFLEKENKQQKEDIEKMRSDLTQANMVKAILSHENLTLRNQLISLGLFALPFSSAPSQSIQNPNQIPQNNPK